jgi:hypothetical protein
VQSPPPQSFIVTVVETPAKEITIADVIFGSLGIVGVLVVVALVLGGILSALLVIWNRRHPPEDRHMPPVAPLIPTSGVPPSFRSR